MLVNTYMSTYANMLQSLCNTWEKMASVEFKCIASNFKLFCFSPTAVSLSEKKTINYCLVEKKKIHEISNFVICKSPRKFLIFFSSIFFIHLTKNSRSVVTIKKPLELAVNACGGHWRRGRRDANLILFIEEILCFLPDWIEE